LSQLRNPPLLDKLPHSNFAYRAREQKGEKNVTVQKVQF
jgi:hypothetical protein